jgi:hypothetical protein
MRDFMNYDDWLKSVPVEISGDLLKNPPLPVLTHHASRITPKENHVA